MKDTEIDRLRQCLEALKSELSAISDELSRSNDRSSRLERGARVKTIFTGITERSGNSGGTSRPSASSSAAERLPRIAETRRNLSGAKKTA